MNIVESRSWLLGKFTVHQRPRIDSPSWACYLVFIGERLIGKSFSMPDLECCCYLERQETNRALDAAQATSLKNFSIRALDKARALAKMRKRGAL